MSLVGLSAKIGLRRCIPATLMRLECAGASRRTDVRFVAQHSRTALLRFYQVVASTDVRAFAQKLLIFAGLFSLAVAAIYMWRSRNYKRLLAYSSVEHLGIIALGVGIGGLALLGALLHLLFNSFGKVGAVFHGGQYPPQLRLARNQADHRPDEPFTLERLCMDAGVFLHLGTPPFGIFFSELFVFKGMIHAAKLAATLAISLIADGDLHRHEPCRVAHVAHHKRRPRSPAVRDHGALKPISCT